MTNEQVLIEIEELKNDVIEHMRQLIMEIDYLDAASVEKIAVSLGVIDHPLNHIEITNKVTTDDISRFLPEGTPDNILIKVLENMEGILQERTYYDMLENLLCYQEEMYSILVEDIMERLKEGFNYSFVNELAFTEDKVDFMNLLSAVNPNGEPVILLVKHRTGAVYELFKVLDDFSKEQLVQKLFDSTIKNEKLELLAALDLVEK